MWCVQSYCINRDQFDFILDVTKFKSKAEWAEDPMKEVDTKTKSAFTRTFNKQVQLLRLTCLAAIRKVLLVYQTLLLHIACCVSCAKVPCSVCPKTLYAGCTQSWVPC
mgnify:CR=1 FL=1